VVYVTHPEPFKNPDARLEDLGYGDRDLMLITTASGLVFPA
jgi:hypothetical protein